MARQHSAPSRWKRNVWVGQASAARSDVIGVIEDETPEGREACPHDSPDTSALLTPTAKLASAAGS